MKRAWLEDVVIALTLCAFAFAQTAYDVLASNPEFIAARRVSNPQLLAVVAAFGLVPALVLGTLWSLCRRLGSRLHAFAFGAFVFFCCLILAWQAHNQYLSGKEVASQTYLLWIIPSLLVAWVAILRRRQARSLLLALSPAVLIFPGIFLYRAWRSPFVLPQTVSAREIAARTAPAMKPNGTPVFMLVFDELTLHVLLDAQGQIDSERYPNFAALAAHSHWFRNATSNSSKTITAIPSIVSGHLPRGGNGDHENYPDTIFTLLAPYYDVYIEEVGYTHFCDSEAYYCLNDATGDGTEGLLRDLGYLLASRVVPAKLNLGLPDTSHTWGPFESAQKWSEAALARSRRVLHALDTVGSDHVLFFAHLILPHSPYALTPEGEIYSVGPYALDEGQDSATLTSLTERYRMQVGYVDRWLGQFLDRLKERGLFDASLLIVTGDHGVSWKQGSAGRSLSQQNAELMLTVPLFVKMPGETESAYSERDVQHIDVLPTIADVLEMQLPFEVDGRSAFASNPAPRSKIAYSDGMARFEFDDKLGLHPVESQAQASPLIGQSIEGFSLVKDKSVRGKIEAMQIASRETPEFAAGTPVVVSGWALQLEPDTPTLEVVTGAARTGEHSLALRGSGGGARQPLDDLTPLASYRAHAWVRGEQGGGVAMLNVMAASGQALAVAQARLSDTFEPLEVSFDAPDVAAIHLSLQSSGSDVVYWDDVSVTPSNQGDAAGDGQQTANVVKNGGFESAGAESWSAYGAEGEPAPKREVAVALNGEIVAASMPGAERWDVAGVLLTPSNRYVRCGWSVSIPEERLQEGKNPVQAFLVLDAEKKIAVPLDLGRPRVLVKKGELLDQIFP